MKDDRNEIRITGDELQPLAQPLAPTGARRLARNSNEYAELGLCAKREYLGESGSDEPLGEPMSVSEVAKLLRCSTWTVRQKHLRQGLPYFQIEKRGKLVFFRKQVLQWVLDQQKKGGMTL